MELGRMQQGYDEGDHRAGKTGKDTKREVTRRERHTYCRHPFATSCSCGCYSLRWMLRLLCIARVVLVVAGGPAGGGGSVGCRCTAARP